MKTVLLVEDHDDSREVLAEALELYGFQVMAFRTGIQAIEYLAGEKPDIVVLDSALPWIDGEEVLRRMRGSPRLADVPAVIISADIRRLKRAEKLTPHVLAKPFDPSLLIVKVEELLGVTGEAKVAAAG